jgi:SAM-dependent methyltransferase
MSSRSCVVCHTDDKLHLHRQFFVSPDIASPLHYDVVECRQCGFIFADSLPAEEALNAYYAASGHHLHVELPDGIRDIHAGMYQFIRQHVSLSDDHRILDIGSSMGHFLNYFKQAGMAHLTGIEPSLEAASLARQHYGIEVHTTPFADYQAETAFDLISLCGVLEHLIAPDQVLAKICDMLSDNGRVFIAVPDADRFGSIVSDEPFLEFALEHINFFGRQSLTRLFHENGFEVLSCDSVYNDFYNNNYLYLIASKAEDESTASFPAGTSSTHDSVNQYIAQSKSLLADIDQLFEALRARQQQLIVWGAGSLTRRLCATTRLSGVELLGFIDKNVDLQGKQLLGKTIHAPAWLADQTDQAIFIASTTYADEIRDELLNQHHWQGDILTLKNYTS